MVEINQKAAFYRIGLQIGVHTVADVVNWIDTEISNTDSPNQLLLDLSLMKEADSKGVLSKLKELSVSTDTISALRYVLAAMYPVLKLNPSYGPTFAKGLDQMCTELNYDLPDDLSPILGLDDEYSLAKQGTYGTEEDAYQGFLKFLAPFSDKYK